MNNINQFKSLLHKLIKEELEGGEEEKPQGLEKIKDSENQTTILRNELNNNPIWYWDKNVIDKVINIDSLKYNNPWKDRLRGDWFNVILSQDKETRFKYIFKWINTKENMYKN